jgi:proteasome lid subunit RPN8/RPN11
MRDEAKHPWIAGDLVISRAVLDRVYEEAKKSYAKDEESCGLLLGPAAEPRVLDEIVPMVNRANALHAMDPEAYPRTGRTYFDIDTLKFQRSIEKGETSDRPVKVLYHSHLDVGAYFSPTDAEVAKMGGDEPPFDLAYLVTSIRAGEVDDHKLFVWDPASRAFVESKLTVVP